MPVMVLKFLPSGGGTLLNNICWAKDRQGCMNHSKAISKKVCGFIKKIFKFITSGSGDFAG